MTEHIIRITEADLSRPDHQAATIELLNGYAMDSMGNGRPLSNEVKQALIPGLQQHPTTIIFLAYQADTPIAIAACFLGFSTFAARPLLNIHDFFVVPSSRGTGVGRHLMAAVERRARELGCCKLTLEVLENNHRARKIYADAGFVQATYVAEAGGALFLTRNL
jgi:GNAT superfamily N-acetyltransferase